MSVAEAEPSTMTAVAFDTYAMVRRLKASGLSEDQAEAITGALRDGRESDLASLATKVDLRETEVALKADVRETAAALRIELREDISALRTELREDISALKTDLRETESRLDAKITDLSHKVTDLSHRMDLSSASAQAEMKLLEQRMTVKLGALVAAGIGIMIAAFRYMPSAGH